MKRSDTASEKTRARSTRGFRISDAPVVGAEDVHGDAEAQPGASDLGELPAHYGHDALYLLPRDPRSVFAYWDLDWPRFLQQEQLPANAALQLRISRGEEEEESVTPIDPARGYCFVPVTAAGAEYSGELGFFAESGWQTLLRSGAIKTPAAELSEDLSAEFATLPLHLSFQRLLELVRAEGPQQSPLANAVGELQAELRGKENAAVPPANWSADALRSAGRSRQSLGSSEFRQLFAPNGKSSTPPAPNAATLERLKQLGERFGGASWGSSSWGGSSRAPGNQAPPR